MTPPDEPSARGPSARGPSAGELSARELTPVELPWHASDGNHCFGCARGNPAGLGLELMASGETLVCDFTLTRLHESYPGIVHGGVASAVLDEVMGNLLIHLERKVCFTTSLRTTFGGALRVGQAYRAVAWLTERPAQPGQLYKVQGEIRDDRGNALVLARGSYQWMTAQSYQKHLVDGEQPAPALERLLRDHAGSHGA
jgi:acyl-coenzyme A thioesterase PaaI-like protein